MAVRPANLSPDAEDRLRPAAAAEAEAEDAAPVVVSAGLASSFGGLPDAAPEPCEDWLLLRGL